MIAKRLFTLADVAEVTHREGEMSYALRDFLDGFYPAPNPAALCDEPMLLKEALADGGLADAYLAATCDHLCRQFWFSQPSWIRNQARVLRTPFFAAKTHALRMIFLQESPTAFRERNIFVSANALSRA